MRIKKVEVLELEKRESGVMLAVVALRPANGPALIAEVAYYSHMRPCPISFRYEGSDSPAGLNFSETDLYRITRAINQGVFACLAEEVCQRRYAEQATI